MPQLIFIFKITLSGSKSIWRRIALKGSQTLDDLHKAIFDAFDRDDEHLYSFFIPQKSGKLTLRKIYDESLEYTSPYMFEGPGMLDLDDQENAADTKINTLKFKKGKIFYYLFDFGDNWWHEITVEEIDAKAERGKYPRILEKKGKSPPQYVYDDE